MKIKPLFFALIAGASPVSAQDNCNCPGSQKPGKGSFYFAWGYNRDWYSASDIHFTDAQKGYDFTIYRLKAKDRPDFDKIMRTAMRLDFSIPQYNYRLGYYFKKKNHLGIELSFDHAKYVVIDNQTARLKGKIGDHYYDADTLISRQLLHFEHTDGANFLMLNFLYRKTLFQSQNAKQWLSLVSKSGAGVVVPKTYVALLGEELDNEFHIAGWIIGEELGLRYDRKHFFAELTGKGAFANYSDVLVMPGTKARHHFWCAELILSAGFQFGL
ncbi:MAG: hypothetical protein AB1458_12695 [Bacteroidota bacterium]